MDISSFIDAPQPPMDTQFENVPDGKYEAMIDATDINTWFGKELTREDGTVSLPFNVPFVIQDEELKKRLGRNKISVRATIWLDMDNGKPSSGKGKNVTLGQLRDALGQNNDPAWSFLKLPGAGPLMVVTTTTTSKKDGKDYVNVTRFSKKE